MRFTRWLDHAENRAYNAPMRQIYAKTIRISGPAH